MCRGVNLVTCIRARAPRLRGRRERPTPGASAEQRAHGFRREALRDNSTARSGVLPIPCGCVDRLVILRPVELTLRIDLDEVVET